MIIRELRNKSKMSSTVVVIKWTIDVIVSDPTFRERQVQFPMAPFKPLSVD